MFIKGYKQSEEHKKRISVSLKGKHNSVSTQFKKNHGLIGNGHKGKKHSEETKRKWSEIRKGRQTGKNHPMWKGGITPLTQIIRHCFMYRQWVSDVFTRDNYTCLICGIRGKYLQADHYPKLFSEIFREYNIKNLEDAMNCEEFWNINNGRTLCKVCHNKYGRRK